jgi:Delta3-Delta2-enoyl-CoA isomerase
MEEDSNASYLFDMFGCLLILFSYPMPTIALINGHAIAGGLMLAMMHDYRIMNPHKGYLCLNELDFGVALKPPMASIFRQKLPRPDTFRTMILEAKRFNALEAIKEGIVDGLGLWEESISFVQEMKLLGRADSGVYGKLKEEMWRETVQHLDRGGHLEEDEANSKTRADLTRRERAMETVDEWEFQARNGRFKL